MISSKFFFQLMVTVFKENMNLLSFRSNNMFVIETVFISEEIKEYMFGALLETVINLTSS